MILTLLAIALAFTWLLKETNYLRINLLIGKEKAKVFAQYKAYNSLKKRKYYDVPIHYGSNAEEPAGVTYQVVFSPGITEPLCGWDWLDKHCADLVDYAPRVQMAIGGVRYDMTIKSPGILDKVMKVNKLTKKQRLQYV